METCPGEEVMKEEKFPNSRKPSHQQIFGEFWNVRGQHTWEKKKKRKSTVCTYPQLPGGEVAQTLASVTREWGLDREG